MLVKPPWICGGGQMAGSGRSFKLRLLRGCRPSARRAATCGSRAGRARTPPYERGRRCALIKTRKAASVSACGWGAWYTSVGTASYSEEDKTAVWRGRARGRGRHGPLSLRRGPRRFSCTLSIAAKAAAAMLGCYRRTDVHDPDAYVWAAVRVLSERTCVGALDEFQITARG